MKQNDTKDGRAEKVEPKPFRVRLPGFILDEDIGFGDAMKRATSYVGIRLCGGCERRAAALDRWFAFGGRRPK